MRVLEIGQKEQMETVGNLWKLGFHGATRNEPHVDLPSLVLMGIVCGQIIIALHVPRIFTKTALAFPAARRVTS